MSHLLVNGFTAKSRPSSRRKSVTLTTPHSSTSFLSYLPFFSGESLLEVEEISSEDARLTAPAMTVWTRLFCLTAGACQTVDSSGGQSIQQHHIIRYILKMVYLFSLLERVVQLKCTYLVSILQFYENIWIFRCNIKPYNPFSLWTCPVKNDLDPTTWPQTDENGG